MNPLPSPIILEAMTRVDARGRFHRADVLSIREVVDALRDRREPLDHPASLFGPWRELGPRAQAALRRAVEADIKGAMDFFPHGDLWTGLVRGAWEWDRFLHDRSALPWARMHLIRWTNRLSGGPLNLRNRFYHALHRWRLEHGRKVGPADLLAALGRTPQWLLGDFAEGVEVDPRARGYWVGPGRNVTYGYMVGVDLMPTPQGICCLEANLQPGIIEEREEVINGNPFVEGILEVARAHLARHVVWLEGPRGPLCPWFLAALHEWPRGTGIQLEVLEDPRLPRRTSVPSGIPEPNRWSMAQLLPDHTLLVRRNEFPVGSDYLVNHKEAFIRSLRSVLAETNETRVHVLPMTRVPFEIPEPQGPGMPNLVYKYSDSLAGVGVFFMRARNTEHALALARELDRRHQEPPGLFQPYRCSNLLGGRRVYDVRAEIFISPLGTWYLASFKREGSRPLPEDLPEGVVSDTGLFASNVSTGGVVSPVGREEKEGVEDAALAVGDALREVLERTFRTRPDRSGRIS